MSSELVRQTPSTAIAPGEIISDDEIRRLFRVAEALAKSGLFRDTRAGSAEVQATKAFAKMIIGRDLGLNTTQSMLGLHVLPNGVQVHYATLLRFVRAQPGHDYRIKERTAEKSVIEWILDGKIIDTTEYTMEEARLAKKADSDMYKQIPSTMLLARNVSRGVKEVFPEALAGIPLYVDDELPVGSEDLSTGEGSGEEPEIELPSEIVAIVERAEKLGATGWTDRATWKYRISMGEDALAASIRAANEHLDAVEAKLENVTEADVVETSEEQTQELETDENLDGGGSPPPDGIPNPVPVSSDTTEGSVEDEPTVQGPTTGNARTVDDSQEPQQSSTQSTDSLSEELRQLYAKRSHIDNMEADDEEEQALKDEALDMVDEQITAQRHKEEAASAGQGSLL